MNGKAITNLKDPVNNQDAATKKYMETHVSNSHVTSSNRSNAFQYVMNNPSHLIEEDDIEFGGLVTFQSSPHSINKKVIDTKLIFDAGHSYYSSRASINLYVLPNGSYTMAFELIWSSDDVDHDTVSLNGISAVETIHDLSNKTFNNYSRLIMQFSKSTDTSPNHLYVDIVIKMKSGKSYPPKLQTYLVCYSVKELQSDVSSQVYDALWGVDGGKIVMNTVIDMGSKKKITGVADGTNDNDAVNKSQLDAYRGYYYYTNDLKHTKSGTVTFPAISNSYPFSPPLGQNHPALLRILLSGYYYITYTDYYKGNGAFKIMYDRDPGVGISQELFTLNFLEQPDWMHFTINAIIKIEFTSQITFAFHTGTGRLYGTGSSSFYIQYMHP